jgi:four helix bundle protein
MVRNQEQGTRNQGFRGLLAWQKADELASETYRALNDAPADRWLKSRTVRAAISVPANIAEGYGRGSLGDYVRFLDIARGSLAELEYYPLFLTREGILETSRAAHLDSLQRETARLLHGLWKSLKQKAKNGTWDRTATASPHDDDVSRNS